MKKPNLSEEATALLMLVVYILPALIAWLALGFPTDRATLGLLGANILTALLAFLREYLSIEKGE